VGRTPAGGAFRLVRGIVPHTVWIVKLAFADFDRTALLENNVYVRCLSVVRGREWFIITAFLTRKRRQLDRRIQLWP